MTPNRTSKLHKKIILTLAFVVFAFLVYPVAADYLGPDRTVSTWTWERLDCHYFAYYDDPNPGYYGCHLDMYYPPDGSCPAASTTAPYFNPTACVGWGGTCGDGTYDCDITPSSSIVGCTNGQTGCRSTEHTTSYSPATISGNVACTGSTVNGWCTGSAELALSSNEPVAGYSITLMEGTRNGEIFACPAGATSYDVALLEGQNDFTFWALSSWGDSSLMGTASGKVDTQSPSITASQTSIGGDNGWYISAVFLSASATDPIPGSGVDSFTYTLDGGAPVAFPGSLTLTDGVHTVLLQATDGAGHVVTLTRSASVDTVVPSSSFTYTPPASGWVRGSVTLTGTSSDVTSGIAQVELSADGGSTWQPLSRTSTWSSLWDTTIVTDGAHLVLARARDVAGNQESTASLTLNVDNTPPQATLDAPASFCPSCGTASLTYAVDDVSSGLASWDLSVDGTSLASGTTSVLDTLTWDGSGLSLGAHTLTLAITDLAGNTTDITVSINLEAAPPVEPPAEKQSFTWFLAAKTPTPLPTATKAASTPTATRTSVVETFAAVPPLAAASPAPLSPDSELPGSSILWGAAAAGVIAAATAYSLAEQRKRKLEEAAARAEAEQQNTEARAREQAEAAQAAARKQVMEAQEAQWATMLAMQQTQAEKDYLDWLRTGKNPPPGYSEVTEAKRLALYQQTDCYQAYEARITAWEETQKQYQTWLRTGENPPPEYADVTETERAAMYQQSQEYQDRQAQTAALAAAQAEPEVKKSTAQVLVKTPQTSWWQQAWESIKRESITAAYNFDTWADKVNNQLYDYHGTVNQPSGVTGQVWFSLLGVSPSSPSDYFFNNYQVSQFPSPPKWPSPNECVTGSMLQDVNLIQDILTNLNGLNPIPHMDLPTFASAWDEHPVLWLLRPPEKTYILGGMLLPQNAVKVFEAHSQYLRDKYGCGYTVELTSGNTPNDLIENLQNGYPTSIHVVQPTSFFDDGDFTPTILGGLPHTVTVIGYDATTDTWMILDPAKSNGLTTWHTDVLMDYWGRRFIFYPPRFSMTTLIPDAVCTPPTSTLTPVQVPTPGQPSSTETPTATP